MCYDQGSLSSQPWFYIQLSAYGTLAAYSKTLLSIVSSSSGKVQIMKLDVYWGNSVHCTKNFNCTKIEVIS